jgi:hypothetical protein
MYSTERIPRYDEYPERDVDASNRDAERTSPNKVHRLRPDGPYRPSGPKSTQVANKRQSIPRRLIRVLGRFSVAVLIGIGATLAWQSYGGEMIRAWAPSLGWLVPASPSAELQALLKPVAIDLAIMKRSVEQLASNQDQTRPQARSDDAGLHGTAGSRAGHQAEYFSVGPACTEGGPCSASQTPTIPSAVSGHFKRYDKEVGFVDVVLIAAEGGACRDYQLASRSYSQRDGCRRVHTCYGADHRNHCAPITVPGGYAVIAAANGKPILVE